MADPRGAWQLGGTRKKGKLCGGLLGLTERAWCVRAPGAVRALSPQVS